jgi:hypothetical protein
MSLELGDRICDFLLSCGGAYQVLTGELQTNVFYALGSRQYVLKEENGEIVYFASWWMIQPEDVEGVMERVKPLDISHGSTVYVSECGNKKGRKGMAEMIGAIRGKVGRVDGAFWHRPAKADKIYHFPRQTGKEVHIGQ